MPHDFDPNLSKEDTFPEHKGPHTAPSKPEPQATPFSFLSRGTDMKLEMLFDALILKALKSLENASLGAVLEKLGTIETNITNLTTKQEQFMAASQELLTRLDTRTNEMSARFVEMGVDIQAIKDRIQALIDGQADIATLKTGLQDILDTKIDPLDAIATAAAADLDAIGKDPNNPFPPPTDPNVPTDPNNPEFASRGGVRGARTGPGDRNRTGDPGTLERQSGETDEQFRARTGGSRGNAGNPGNAGRLPNETVEQFNARRARGG